jgi:hypothetical protein
MDRPQNFGYLSKEQRHRETVSKRTVGYVCSSGLIPIRSDEIAGF